MVNTDQKIFKTVVTMEAEVPAVPNFVRLTNGVTCDVCELDDGSLRRLADAWGLKLLEHARSRRRAKSSSHG